MKKIIIYLAVCLIAFSAACTKDKEIITVSGLESSNLVASETVVVLTVEAKEATVLAISWNESELTLSNTSLGLPEGVPMVTIEVSSSENFENIQTVVPEDNSYAFSGGELNTIAKNLEFTAGTSTPMYFRVNAAYGNNTSHVYSNVTTVNVTCYTIDMSKAFVLDADKAETGVVLYSPDSDGNYHGFTGVSGWYNWFLLEGDGTVWGNLAVDGNAFKMSTDAPWNFWYPGVLGCYYTTASTSDLEWTATLIPTLKVSGDISAEMTFVRTEMKWFISVTTTVDNATVQVSCSDAKLYNFSTGTDDASAIDAEVGFIPGTNGRLSIDMSAASAGDITFGAAGDYTLTFYLADPTNWHYEITDGLTTVEDPLTEFLYLPGIDDGINGPSWTFDNYLRLISPDDSTFAGVVNVNSLYGYQMAMEVDNWTDYYGMGASEGSLLWQGANITAPSAGLYLIQADIKEANLTYNHTAISDVYYTGFNDDWNTHAMTASGTVGVYYTSSLSISAVSTYGGQILLNDNWDLKYGGPDGQFTFGAPTNITEDANIGTGTYDFIVDIINQTYVFLGDEVYITGLNDVWDFTSVVLTKQSTGVYTGTATITAASTYGITIHVDQSWSRYFGGTFESMTYLGENITDDQSLANGTYDVTVDFINNTCTFVVQ